MPLHATWRRMRARQPEKSLHCTRGNASSTRSTPPAALNCRKSSTERAAWRLNTRKVHTSPQL
eukprot:6703453-Alexandrium_andersonii.AAC.1